MCRTQGYSTQLNCTVKINRPLQLIIPFEINKTVESESTRPRRVAAVNADIKRKLTTEIISQRHFFDNYYLDSIHVSKEITTCIVQGIFQIAFKQCNLVYKSTAYNYAESWLHP